MKKADVICIVYAVNDAATKESIQTRWLPQIRRLGLNVHHSHSLTTSSLDELINSSDCCSHVAILFFFLFFSTGPCCVDRKQI